MPEIFAYFQESDATPLMMDHFHVRHELILVEGGEARFGVGGKEYIAAPGSLVIIGHLEQHDMQILSAPYRRYVLQVSHEFCLKAIRDPRLASIFLYRPSSFRHILPLSAADFDSIRLCFCQLIEECGEHPPLWRLQTQLLFESLMLRLYRTHPSSFIGENNHAVQTVFEVQRYMAEHYQEPLSLASLAQQFYISQYYLSRIFKSVTGYGFQKYLQLYRINQAKRLLQSTNLSVNDICFSVGYSDVNNFIRLFRTQEGITPLQFRKTVASSASETPFPT